MLCQLIFQRGMFRDETRVFFANMRPQKRLSSLSNATSPFAPNFRAAATVATAKRPIARATKTPEE